MSTKRIKLVVSYDGTDFRGWAAQAGQRTVQGTLKEAVLRATGEDLEIIGASRTDSGAHALGQVCHFDSSVRLEPSKWARVLNRVLPSDVAVRESREVGGDFHSRFCAEWRRYRYRIRTAPRDPLQTRYVHDFGRPVDVERMRNAANQLEGEHDFTAFSEELEPTVENRRRRVLSAKLIEGENEVGVEITATAFMRGMMRRISGALLEVGRGHRPTDDIAALLSAQKDRLQWPVVLPAKGLTLLEVSYADPPRDFRAASELA